MTKIVYVKTNRTRNGYAKAEISRFMNYSNNRVAYSFKFYSTHKFFDTYGELKAFVDANYELLNYNFGDLAEYHLPMSKDDFFR